MKKLITVMVFLFPLISAASGERASYEMRRVQVVPIQDSASDKHYELYIKLPENYATDKTTSYPVIYFTDAAWHIEALSAATEYMMENAILVGISWQQDIGEDLKQEYGDHASRFSDYSFWEKSNPKHPKLQFGQANNHLAFIRNDVFKYIENTYRTDSNNRSYFGYSLGGLFGAYTLLIQPETFKNYILGSPSVQLLTEGEYKVEFKNIRRHANVLITHGDAEKEIGAHIEAFVTLLRKSSDNKLSIKQQVIEGNHQSAFPLTAVRAVYWLTQINTTGKKNNAPVPEATAAEAELSFSDIPPLAQAYIDARPTARKDGIVVGELGVDGGNKKQILQLAQEIADSKHGNFDSMLIAHKGKLLFESYYLRGRINLPHPQASATKAYTGLALGRVIQLGYLSVADLDQPVASFLQELDPTHFVAGVDKITLNQALTMRGGLRISDEKWDELKENSAALQGQGLVQVLFEHSEPITAESQKFSYGNFNPNLVMQVIEAVVPGSAEEFIKKELLDKMGITDYGWRSDEVSGLPVSGSRSSMTSRDMIKWGTLVMDKGQWNGEQLIPEAFISTATNRVILTPDEKLHYGGKDVSNQGYGYFWWSADLNYDNNSYSSRSAQGGWGQFIILIDALDLMVVFTAHDNDTNYLQLTAEKILPAFIE